MKTIYTRYLQAGPFQYMYTYGRCSMSGHLYSGRPSYCPANGALAYTLVMQYTGAYSWLVVGKRNHTLHATRMVEQSGSVAYQTCGHNILTYVTWVMTATSAAL